MYTPLYSELIRYTTQKPFNFLYGLTLLTNLLPIPLPIALPVHKWNESDELQVLKERKILSSYLEPLFYKEKAKKTLFDEWGSNTKKTHSIFANLVRTICVSSTNSNVNILMKVSNFLYFY